METSFHDHNDFTYEGETEGFSVSVTPEYVPEHSRPDQNQFVYAYFIRIDNNGMETAKLIRRYWRIRTSKSYEKTVEGKGVVGKTPVIAPGESFEYTSFCPLPSPYGSMRGHFLFEREDKSHFRVDVPLFFFRPQRHEEESTLQ